MAIPNSNTHRPEYDSWAHARDRCHNPASNAYDRYGAKGILMCERWRNSFEMFVRDMGKRPSSEHSLDRYPDPHGNYEPENCRWATRLEQAQNTRANLNVTINGETHCLSEWARIKKVPVGTLYYRIIRGALPEDAILRPVRARSTRKSAPMP